VLACHQVGFGHVGHMGVIVGLHRVHELAIIGLEACIAGCDSLLEGTMLRLEEGLEKLPHALGGSAFTPFVAGVVIMGFSVMFGSRGGPIAGRLALGTSGLATGSGNLST
jgi:hypothetical protein